MPEPPIETLRRWEDSGATWKLYELTEEHAVVDLCTCTGEPVERLESDDDELLRYLRERLADA
jgi:hypothetical protein